MESETVRQLRQENRELRGQLSKAWAKLSALETDVIQLKTNVVENTKWIMAHEIPQSIYDRVENLEKVITKKKET